MTSLAIVPRKPGEVRIAAELGDAIELRGALLTGDTVTADFRHPSLNKPNELRVMPGSSATLVKLILPQSEDAADPSFDPAAIDNWPAGTYSVGLRIERTGKHDQYTNDLPFSLAPRLLEAPKLTGGLPDPRLTLKCVPKIWPGQRAHVLVGSEAFAPDAIRTKTDAPTAVLKNVTPADGRVPVRLRVDGVDSQLVRDRQAQLPEFELETNRGTSDMTATTPEKSNQEFLQAAVAWLRAKLAGAGLPQPVGEESSKPPFWRKRPAAPRAPARPDVAGARERLNQTATAMPTPSFVQLAQAFGLSPFEQDLLLLAAAMEVDTSLPSAMASASGDPSRRYPTFALAMALFPDPTWDAMSPERPLRAYRLIEVHQASATSLLAAPLRIDERIAAYIKGLNYLDERLAPSANVLAPIGTLPPSQEAVADVLERWLADGGSRGIVQLTGARSHAKADLVSRAAMRAGRQAFLVRADALPDNAEDLETFVRLWSRESKLIPLVLLISGVEGFEPLAGEDAIARPRPRWPQALARLEAPCVVDVRQPLVELEAAPSLALDPPSPSERRALWQQALAIDDVIPDEASVAQLADEFQLSVSEIKSIAGRARRAANWAPHVSEGEGDSEATPREIAAAVADAWDRCASQAGTALAGLTRWVRPRATLDDVKLPVMEKTHIERLVAHALNRAKVKSEFGFAERGGRGLGLAALFHGESGTGKTFAAEAVADALSVGLAVVDLATVKSKYIGETEKNLRRIFDAAEAGGAVLFFDEADALFGKRSEVKDSHDRYANIEINYLLMRMENFSGVAILATNQKHALDPAFMRRLKFVVSFPFPGIAERKEIWQSVFPQPALASDLEFDRLSRFQLTGGSIFDAALAAAHEAAAKGASVEMTHVLDAVRWELRKLERPIAEGDFRWTPLQPHEPSDEVAA